MKVFTVFLLVLIYFSGCKDNVVQINIVETTDVHGRFFNYDFAKDTFKDGSLAQFSTYLKTLQPESSIVIDNGDIIQGTPVAWYANYEDKADQHFLSLVYDYLGYDAAVIGNHDVEAGPEVYNKIYDNLKIPWLAANIVNSKNGQPVFKPFTIIEKKGVKIAVLGLITPGIPNWLPPKLYQDLTFNGMVSSAKKWIKKINELQPDIVVGVFHAGLDVKYGGFSETDSLNPNATLLVAKHVKGFDFIFAGHDHKNEILSIQNDWGDTVMVIDGGCNAKFAGLYKVTYNKSEHKIVNAEPEIIDLTSYDPDPDYLNRFGYYLDSVKKFFNEPIGKLGTKLCPGKALFGPSLFMTFIHNVQLATTGAEVSLSAPLQIKNCIDTGTIRRSNVFALYRYENYLATIDMTVDEIDRFLEYAVGQWFNASVEGESVLKMKSNGKLQNPYFNFSSALGLEYIVDLQKQTGDMVSITRIPNHEGFCGNDTLRVTMNSYRVVGGGGHLPSGVGLNRDVVKQRNLWISEFPIKKYIIDQFMEDNVVMVDPVLNWKVIPELRKEKAMPREMKVLGIQ